jgi:uncharacterized protein YndB with AHSA1/START domain
MGTTRLSRHIRAPRGRVYQALIDAGAVQQWMVPDSMTSHVHSFDAREGGAFRVSLTYDAPTGTGKTSAQTDTYHGRFVRLVPGEQVVQGVEFETADPALQGEMTIAVPPADRELRRAVPLHDEPSQGADAARGGRGLRPRGRNHRQALRGGRHADTLIVARLTWGRFLAGPDNREEGA